MIRKAKNRSRTERILAAVSCLLAGSLGLYIIITIALASAL